MQFRSFAPLSLLLLGACATGPTPQDRAALQNGYAQFSARQYAAASSSATNYIQKFPDGPNADEAYYLRGIALAANNQNDAAGANLRMAMQITKREDLRAKSLHTMGDMAYEGQRWSEARDFYQQALRYYAAPDSMTLFRIGAAYQAEGRWAEARPVFVQVAGMNPATSNAAVVERARLRAGLQNYALQFGAYSDVAAAQTQAAQLKTVGINALVYPEKRGTQTVYVIRAGSYRTLNDAEAAKNAAIRSHPNTIIFP